MVSHKFYYVLQSSPNDQHDFSARATNIEAKAKELGLSCHRENFGDTITLQIESNDDGPAFMLFTLANEPAFDESHE